MPDYRVYSLDSEGRISGPPAVISATDDEDAKEQAQKLLADASLEIWHGDRRVAVLLPKK
jgi:hypothetical protein